MRKQQRRIRIYVQLWGHSHHVGTVLLHKEKCISRSSTSACTCIYHFTEMSSRIICEPPDNNCRDEALTRSARFGWFPPMNSRFLPTAFTHSLTASYKSSRTSSRSRCLDKGKNQFVSILTFYHLSLYGLVLVCK